MRPYMVLELHDDRLSLISEVIVCAAKDVIGLGLVGHGVPGVVVWPCFTGWCFI